MYKFVCYFKPSNPIGLTTININRLPFDASFDDCRHHLRIWFTEQFLDSYLDSIDLVHTSKIYTVYERKIQLPF